MGPDPCFAALRSREYPLLDKQQHVYLDYTAANLVAVSQLERHFAVLRSHVLGNPHSTNPASADTTCRIERTRQAVLRFFNASSDE